MWSTIFLINMKLSSSGKAFGKKTVLEELENNFSNLKSWRQTIFKIFRMHVATLQKSRQTIDKKTSRRLRTRRTYRAASHYKCISPKSC